MSAQQRHTPGPWEVVHRLSASENHKGFFIRAEKASRNGKWALADVQPGDEDGNLGLANAQLIAAAPDLRDALEAILSSDHPLVRLHPDHVYVARLALAKATGGTQ